jgi:hypothetical protein
MCPYSKGECSSSAAQSDAVKNEVDPGFINDNYWLVFPFHAYWDTSATVTDQGVHKLPVGNGSAELVAVKLPNQAGYKPGHTWELYVGKGNRVEQFLPPRGPKKPSLVMATCAGYKKGRSSADLNGAPRHSRRQAPAHLPF